MKSWLLVISMLVVLALGAGAQAAVPAKGTSMTPASAAFNLTGKVLRVSKGRIELQVTRIEKAAGLKAGQKIWIQETAKTKVTQAGKPVAVSMLKAGEQVEVYGTIVKAKTGSRYGASTIQIVTPR